MIFIAVVLGLVQGLTEFIPVSSSGHLVIFDAILGAEQSHLFLQFINIGTLLALLFFFRKTIWEVLRERDWALMLNLLIIALPAGLVGVLLGDLIERTPFFMSVFTVLGGLLVVGVLMIFAEKLPKLANTALLGGSKGGVRGQGKGASGASGDTLTPRKSLFIGLVQILALIPGVSRSGSTILAGKSVGLTDANAARFSFLASIPIMLGVVLRLLFSSDAQAYWSENWQFLLLGNLVALVSGVFAIKFLLKILSKKGNLKYFGWYRVGLVAVIAFMLAFGILI